MRLKLDKIDGKILSELDVNPRLPTSQIARKIRISQQVTDYRLKNLIKKKVITNIGTIINYHFLGFQQYRILFTFSEISLEQKKDIFSYLAGNSQVYWAASIGGKWDLIVVVITEDYNHLIQFLTIFYNKFRDYILGYDLIRILFQEFYRHHYLIGKKEFLIIDSRPKRPFELVKELDPLDYQILHEIKNNARSSALEIGTKLGCSYKTIQNRLIRLQEKKIISGYRLFLQSSELGYQSYQLLLNLDNYAQHEIDALIAFARYHPLITQTLLTLGEWDFYFHLQAKNFQDVQQLIIELRNKFRFIKDFQSTPIFETITLNNLPMSKELTTSKNDQH